MSEVKMSKEAEIALVNNIINMAKTFDGLIGEIAKAATDAYMALDPFLKARDTFLDKFIHSSDKKFINIMLVFEEKELLGKWVKYIDKKILTKILGNPSSEKDIDIILVDKADTTSVKFNQIDVGIRVQYSTDILDDDYYAIGVETEESFYPDKDGYLGVPFVNIYYNPNALATGK